jgi:hypothetical protein
MAMELRQAPAPAADPSRGPGSKGAPAIADATRQGGVRA